MKRSKEEAPASMSIVVAGDVTLDWNIARTRRFAGGAVARWTDDAVHATWQRGGCALLADLIEALAAECTKPTGMTYAIHRQEAPSRAAKVSPNDPRFHHSFAVWAPFKYGEAPSQGREKPSWRVEEFLGLDRMTEALDATKVAKLVDDDPNADLVVLDDANLGFRVSPERWPLAITGSRKKGPWILLKMATPVAQGALWEHLHAKHSNRMIVVTTVDDLRLTEVQISRELSWERTAQDMYWELVHNPCVNALAHCAYVVVSFGTAGAIMLSRKPRERAASSCLLFFDPKVMEGMWERDYPGGVIGYTSCLVGGIVRQMMMAGEMPDIGPGIQTGLSAMRVLHLQGYGERGTSASEVGLRFPLAHVAAALGKETRTFAVAEVQDPLRFIKAPADSSDRPITPGFWTILQDRYRGALDRVAEQIVLEGPEAALQGVPLGQFGHLLTVDRQEIESFRSIRTLIAEYCRQGQQKRPLSIAVFGAPGSGKSFGIVEVASSLLPGQIEVREFNLSQLASLDDLLAALHQVRDVGLSGKIPLVFWDEFDTTFKGEPLGWLRYFLAPMQDGRFQEGQISHPIGRSIFVFAGGTATNMAEFGQGLPPDAFRSAKGPDFVSRLKGYVNTLGPNQVKAIGDRPIDDPYYIIRRAILLRTILKRSAPQLLGRREGKELLDIDGGVLRALLKTREYRHGVRSIESIIAMSQLAGKESFERSSLPSEAQLDLHVDGQDFLALVQQIGLTGSVLEALAEAAHDIFCDEMRSKGYKPGPLTDDKLKTHGNMMPYAELAEEVKEQNRQNVRDIPSKLVNAGYVMIPARSNERAFSFPGEALEMLAMREHERWMQSKMAYGWSYAPETDPEKKTHRALVAWDELPEVERAKDRDLVRAIPRILARAGYAIVKSRK